MLQSNGSQALPSIQCADARLLDRSRLTADTAPEIKTSPAQRLLGELLTSYIVLREDFEKLSDQGQSEIRECAEVKRLLPALVQHGLLTEYQADRVAAGKTHGLILGNYRVLDRLGAGGMGVVFKAEHVDMRRPVAIKVLPIYEHQDPRLQQRFLTEIRIVAQLQHPNIVAAMDAGKSADPDSPCLRYFVMEFVPGQDLEEFVKSNGPLSVIKACDVAHQIAAALAEAHKHRLVHRDIKPSNIRLTPDGQAKLLDFGLARRVATHMTEPGTVLGTLDYMAPEQTIDAHAVDIRADIYGLGATLFWCLTGKPPFAAAGNVVQLIAHRQSQPPPSVLAERPDVPAELDAILARMMALRADDRFATPQDVMEALLALLQPDKRNTMFASPELLGEQSGGERKNGKHRILVVDDEPETRRFCKYALDTQNGLLCDEADNGSLALEMIRKNRYDAVLMDIEMPVITGPEVCRRLRETPPYPYLKIIMMSGRATPDEMARMLQNGSDDYLSKPLSIVQLQAKVKAALTLRDAQDRSDHLNAHLHAVNHELERTLEARNSDMVEARNGLLHALAKLVEYRDGETGSHLTRIKRYCRCLAEEAAREPAFAGQLDANFIELLACCAPLHDIGKIGLPDHILLKPGELTANERILMQAHTTMGADTLQEVLKQHGHALAFLQMAADIARHHHERFDGEGYPDQLTGPNIPLSARLVAVSDVYDALRCRRTYKPALSHAAAVRVMTTVLVGQFDPHLLQAFQRCGHHFERIFSETED